MEDVIELGAGDRLAHQGEDRRNAAAEPTSATSPSAAPRRAAAVSRVTRPDEGNAGSQEMPLSRPLEIINDI